MRSNFLSNGVLPEWEPIAAIFSAMGDPTRQRILLAFDPNEELSIAQIASHLQAPRSTTAHHLLVLTNARLLSKRAEGRQTLFRLQPHPLLDALSNVHDYVLQTHLSTPNPSTPLAPPAVQVR